MNKKILGFVCLLAMQGPLRAAPLSDRLLASDDRTRQDASEEVSNLTDSEKQKLVTSLIHTLKGSDIDQRERAILILGKLGSSATPALPALRQALGDDYPVIRQRAIDALKAMGPASVPTLETALKSDTSEIRVNAAQTLAEMVSDSGAQEAALPALSSALQNKDASVREQALRGLEHIGKPGLSAVTPLLQSNNDVAKIEVIKLLTKTSAGDASVCEQLVSLWNKGDPGTRIPIARALTKQGSVCVEAISSNLEVSEPALRRLAAETLGDMGRPAAAAVPGLIKALKDSDATVRASAAEALGKMGSRAAPAIPSLREAAKDGDATVALRASEALTNITATHVNQVEKKKDALPDGALQIPMTGSAPQPEKGQLANHRKANTPRGARKPKPTMTVPRAPAATAGNIEKWVALLTSSAAPTAVEAKNNLLLAGEKAVPSLVKALRNSDKVDRWTVLTTLGEMGPPAKSAWLAILEFVSDFSSDLRHAAALALVKIAPIDAEQSLAGFLQGKDPTPKAAAAAALGYLGASGAPVVTILIEQLKSTDPELREAAAISLAQIGTPEATAAVTRYREEEKNKEADALRDDLGKNLSQVNYKAVGALAKMGKDAVPVLQKTLSDDAAVIRQGAALALKQIGPAAAPATQALIVLLGDPQMEVRHAAADALQAIGTPEAMKPLPSFRLKSRFFDPWDTAMRKMGFK